MSSRTWWKAQRLNGAVRLGRQRPGERDRRIGPQDSLLLPVATLARLNWDPGDYAAFDVAPMYRFTRMFAVGFTLGYYTQQRDRYTYRSAQDSIDVMANMGGVPLSLTTNEYYEALQRGTAEGVVTGFTAFAPFKLQEVTSYHVDVGLGTAAGMVFMSKKRYEALPAAVRKVIDDNSGEAQSRLHGQYFDRQNDEGRENVKARKHTVVELSAEQYAAWKRKIAPAVDALVQQRPGGEQYLRAFRAEVAAVRKAAAK